MSLPIKAFVPNVTTTLSSSHLGLAFNYYVLAPSGTLLDDFGSVTGAGEYSDTSQALHERVATKLRDQLVVRGVVATAEEADAVVIIFFDAPGRY